VIFSWSGVFQAVRKETFLERSRWTRSYVSGNFNAIFSRVSDTMISDLSGSVVGNARVPLSSVLVVCSCRVSVHRVP
jgi:hypothetical protein